MSNERETVAKLSDFGVAKYVYASSRYLNTTIAGTQQFMAPEVQLQTGHSTNADVRPTTRRRRKTPTVSRL